MSKKLLSIRQQIQNLKLCWNYVKHLISLHPGKQFNINFLHVELMTKQDYITCNFMTEDDMLLICFSSEIIIVRQ